MMIVSVPAADAVVVVSIKAAAVAPRAVAMRFRAAVMVMWVPRGRRG
ncbi:hypothetical protein GCM10010320_32680 [Streptomyces caelestis]|nr:hypothetical protein GCM10010320_32680 [Streptomyces caelestis]